MQFKYPEILYALLLLIIPILVHLFQLQRFVRVPFTNVKFLKNIEQQTRKSARLKKWLILATRMMALTCLIIAFSQPFFSKKTRQQNFHTTIYLDNSFSMQAKGNQGELLKSISQKIIENSATHNNPITLVTNDDSFINLDASNLKNELINIQYSSNKVDLSTILLRLDKLKPKKSNTVNKNLLISDFQTINFNNNDVFKNVNTETHLLKTTPNNQNNIYIDSVYLTPNTTQEIILNVSIKSVKNTNLSIPISLTNGTKLIGKTTAKFDNSNQKTIEFSIPKTNKFDGKISITDHVITFDNDFYFSISSPTKTKVLCIGDSSAYLAKIYTENEFSYKYSSLKNLNYNILQNQQLVILNELNKIPTELINAISNYLKNGGHIVIIPSENCDFNSFNALFYKLKIGQIKSKTEGEHQITSINYNHPLIKNVFEKKVTNFQYPTTNIYYSTLLNSASSILKLDNNQSFISSINNKNNTIYWVASPLDKNITNFTQSSLVVPIFYNFAKNSLKASKLYYTINPETSFDIKATVGKDEVLKISNGYFENIPLQTISQNKVTINLENTISKNGFYTILNNTTPIETIALNYNNKESNLQYTHLKSLIDSNKNITISTSVDKFFADINNLQKINWLFKWFLAFSVLFLFIEMLILKYFKI